MIGIINYKEDFSVIIVCILNTIYGVTQQFITSDTLVNNNLKDENVITLPGNIISINSIIIVNAVNITFNYYYLFHKVCSLIFRHTSYSHSRIVISTYP